MARGRPKKNREFEKPENVKKMTDSPSPFATEPAGEFALQESKKIVDEVREEVMRTLEEKPVFIEPVAPVPAPAPIPEPVSIPAPVEIPTVAKNATVEPVPPVAPIAAPKKKSAMVTEHWRISGPNGLVNYKPGDIITEEDFPALDALVSCGNTPLKWVE